MASTSSSSSASSTLTGTEEPTSKTEVSKIDPSPPPTTTATDYVDISKHLINDPMCDLLTDTHITNFLQICVDYFNGKERIKKFQYVNPTFFESPYETEDVLNFIQDFDSKISVLFIPICYSTHWVLFVLRPKSWVLDVYNSLENIVIPVVYRMKVASVCEFLFKCSKKLLVKLHKLPKCLQQKDGVNCGVFLCVYIEQIIRYGKVCDVVNFNIEEERLRLDWIFYEVQRTMKKPLYWPPFCGEPILGRDSVESSEPQSEDSKDNEFETSDEDSEDDENVDPPPPPLPSAFLVRDWSYSCDAEYGFYGGERILAKRLEIEEKMHPELRQLREQIHTSFDKNSCFLMPHPGLKVAQNPVFRGELEDIEEAQEKDNARLCNFIEYPRGAAQKNSIPEVMQHVATQQLGTFVRTEVKIWKPKTGGNKKTYRNCIQLGGDRFLSEKAQDLETKKVHKLLCQYHYLKCPSYVNLAVSDDPKKGTTVSGDLIHKKHPEIRLKTQKPTPPTSPKEKEKKKKHKKNENFEINPNDFPLKTGREMAGAIYSLKDAVTKGSENKPTTKQCISSLSIQARNYLPAFLANRKPAHMGTIDLHYVQLPDGRCLYTYDVDWKENIKEAAAAARQESDFADMLNLDRVDQLSNSSSSRPSLLRSPSSAATKKKAQQKEKPQKSSEQQQLKQKLCATAVPTPCCNKQLRRCDGPCSRQMDIHDLTIIGLCEHVACEQCLENAPRIEASFGGLGCHVKCYLLDLASLCPDKKQRMATIRRAYALESFKYPAPSASTI